MLPRRHPAVVCRSVETGAVLLQTEDEVYYGLNRVGLQVWELLSSELGDVETLCCALSERYPDVPMETLRADVLELLDGLRAGGLIVDAA